ncbi:hypothetical protein [Streptomyces sp. NPDC088554]|uniref:hypothetical protein n=1 Tax=Streptomyces sp. NPDC088554 TaxID=3365865 RepID=UPI00380F6F36
MTRGQRYAAVVRAVRGGGYEAAVRPVPTQPYAPRIRQCPAPLGEPGTVRKSREQP